ncbi:MAG: hypothetical protein N2595_05285 [bacterium]|nr:hypothetical protein [bacterium]
MNKVLMIVLIVVAVVAVALGVLLGIKWSENKKLAADLNTTKTEYDAYKKKATADIAALENAKAELEQAKSTLTKQIKDLEVKLTGIERKAREAVAAEMRKLENDLKEAKGAAAAAEEALSTAKKDLAAKEEALAARDKTIAEKEAKIGELNKTVAEWQAKEKAASDLAERYKKRLLENKISLEPDRQFRGHVLVVNKEQDFLILDLGSDDMLPVGTKLKVVRDNHLIGTVEVKKLLPDYGKLSVAVVESLVDPANPVRENDMVKN